LDKERDVVYQLYGINGDLILTNQIKGQFVSENLSLSELPSGNYVLKFGFDNNQYLNSFKILKQ